MTSARTSHGVVVLNNVDDHARYVTWRLRHVTDDSTTVAKATSAMRVLAAEQKLSRAPTPKGSGGLVAGRHVCGSRR